MLSPSQVEEFHSEGFVRVPTAFEGTEAMVDALWEFVEPRGIRRDDPATWPSGPVSHLQGLRTHPVYEPIGTAAAPGLDQVLGEHRWARPKHWGQFLVTFPGVPTAERAPVWHLDAPFTTPREPAVAAWVFSYLDTVEPDGGGTLVLAGSPRLAERFAASRPSIGAEKMKASRRAFWRSQPWLEELAVSPPDGDTVRRFGATEVVDGVPVRVVELTGEPGDLVFAHPLLAHCPTDNHLDRPRFMRIARVLCPG